MKYKNIFDYKNKIEKLVNDKYGIIIEGNIFNSTSKIKIKCKNNHMFSITATKIQQGRWCSYCRRVSFDEIQNFVRSKCGNVTGDFKDLKSKLNFTCENNHNWTTSAAHVILQKTWCPVCNGTIKLDISWFHQLAISHGGRCLSTEYKTQQDKLEFVCKNNHHWSAFAKHIRAGCWCQHCHIHVGEEICRQIFEDIFKEKFPKYKPNWLKNKYGYNLELDGYSEKLKLAFEHQGKQHYGIDIFGCGDNGLRRIIENDTCKKMLCEQNNIKLIEIPQIFDLTKPKDLPQYLIQQFTNADISSYDKEKLLQMKISRRKI